MTRKKKLARDLLAEDFAKLGRLADEMRFMARTVDQMPDDASLYSDKDLGTLEEVRHQALNLARISEAALETIEGTKNNGDKTQ